MGLALSTSWNASRVSDAEKLVFEITELGFKEIELSFNLLPQAVTTIEKLVALGKIKVSSLHNYCPIPDGLTREQALPDCYSMASLDEEERAQAIKFTKRTMECAKRLGAGAVVLHCGRVEVADRTRDLINIYEKAGKDNLEFARLKSDIVKERENRSKPFLEKALNSLDTLGSFAGRLGISLGVETRFYYREIPTLEEIGLILDKFKGSNIGYWHDAGHAQVMENLGFSRHIDFLTRYGQRMIGSHLHDLLGCRDHMAPGKGGLDFKKILPYLKKDAINVIEAHSPASAVDLKESKVFLEKLLDDRL